MNDYKMSSNLMFLSSGNANNCCNFSSLEMKTIFFWKFVQQTFFPMFVKLPSFLHVLRTLVESRRRRVEEEEEEKK
jgi:hypothetical protein